MQYPIKAVIFDLDGVIINSNPAIEAFWKSWADRENILLSRAQVREWIHGRKIVDTLQGIFHHSSDETREAIRASAYIFDQEMNPGPVPGVVSFIKELNQYHIPVGIATSSHHERMLHMLQQIGIADRFNDFVTAHDVTKGKPDPEPYLAMSHKLGIAPADCLVFEDAISGIQSATAAGMHSIGIGDEDARTGLLQEGARDVVPDFQSLYIEQRTLVTPGGIRFMAG